MDSALSTAVAQLDALRARIVELAPRESELQGRFIAWTDAYTLASDRVERLLVHRRYVAQAFAAAGGDPLRLHSLVWAGSRLTHRLRDLERTRDALAASTPRANPSVTAAAINASMWCHGCAGGAYVTGLIPRVEAAYDLYARL